MKTLIFPTFIFLLVLISCRKEEEKIPVLAGNINAEMLHHEFNPVLKVQLQTDSVNNLKYGKDSVDLNLDGNYDFFIFQNLFIDWEDTLPAEYCIFNTKLILKSGLELVSNTETYYQGLGQTKDVVWADTIQVGNKINASSDWSGTGKTVFMWVQPPEPTMSNGCWFNVLNEERYFGIRMKINSEYKYGWVKLNQDSDRNIEILSYAIEI